MADSADHPLREHAAKHALDRAKLAIEHAVPKGCHYVVVLTGPGFNTYGTDLDKSVSLEILRACVARLQLDLG